MKQYFSQSTTTAAKTTRLVPSVGERSLKRDNYGLRGLTFGSNFYTTTNYIQETNIFMLNLSYGFNQSDEKAKLPVSEFGEKEY